MAQWPLKYLARAIDQDMECLHYFLLQMFLLVFPLFDWGKNQTRYVLPNDRRLQCQTFVLIALQDNWDKGRQKSIQDSDLNQDLIKASLIQSSRLAHST